MTDVEIRIMSDEDLIDQILRAGGSTTRFSPYLDKLKAEMLCRLKERHNRMRSVGWGSGISGPEPQPP